MLKNPTQKTEKRSEEDRVSGSLKTISKRNSVGGGGWLRSETKKWTLRKKVGLSKTDAVE